MVKGIGAHMPTSKGVHKVPGETRKIGGNAFQIFPHNPRSWRANLLKDETARCFKKSMEREELDFNNAFAHSGYLINLASPNEENWRKSVECLKQEVRICHQLGIKYLNIHPGSHLGAGEEFGISQIQRALDEVLAELGDLGVVILLENVTPKGGNIGHTIKQLARIRNGCAYKELIGMTFDTCHGFDSGYDVRDKNAVDRLLKEIDVLLGIERLKMIHLNDSMNPLGSGKDRHAPIGEGHIGDEGFRVFLSFEALRNVPLIVETPGSNEEHAKDIERIKEILASIGVV
ncbi:MAG: endonuclease IV [Thermotogae bacterium]|nr:deoxyribonuclease IV [Thermotogota bacterium]RKX44595.1 MAG: endonuclease IV [Thermotogota bacterium]